MSTVIELDGSPTSTGDYSTVSDRPIDKGIKGKLTTSMTRKGRGFNSKSCATRDGVRSRVEEFEQYHGPKNQDLSDQAQRSVEGWIVLITNVHEEATEEDVMDKFCEYGKIRNLQLSIDRRTGFVKGYALIAYNSYKEATCAIEKANGSKLLGQKLHCDFAFTKPPPLNNNKRSLSQRIGFKKSSSNRRYNRSRSPPRRYN